jgi:uncharacterized protein
MPHRSSVPMVWRMEQPRYRLVSSKCKHCSITHFPSRSVCPDCNNATENDHISGFGEVVSFTKIHATPAGFGRKVPYTLAIIKLVEGPMISGEVVNENVQIGSKVKTVFRKLYDDVPAGLIHYGFKFELVE